MQKQYQNVKSAVGKITVRKEGESTASETATDIASNVGGSANQQDDFMWEACLIKMLQSAKRDTINFKAVNF